MGGIISQLYNNNVAWVSDDTQLVLPPMSVDPNMVIVSGFSGGAFYSTNLAIIYSETFAGGGAKAGGPWGARFMCNKKNADKCDSDFTSG